MSVTDADKAAGSDPGAAGFTQPTTPTIQVPRGGGALRGIDEKFGVNPTTGTGTMSMPIVASPGRSGFGPRLTLAYDSGAGNGPFGLGWKIDLPTITRKTDKGVPRYHDAEESDVYILSSAEDLVPVPGDHVEDGYAVRRYRPRIESLFARIERWTHLATGEIHWRSVSRSNVTARYGTRPDSRIADPANPGHRILSWLIDDSWDDKGNIIIYEYVAENDRGVDVSLASEHGRTRTANRYLKTIRYGNETPDRDQPGWHFEIVFDYDDGCYEAPAGEDPRHVRVARLDAAPHWATRPDPFSSYRAGFEIRTYRRCRRVLMFHRFEELGDEPCLVRSTDFDYADLDDRRPVAPEVEAAHDGSTRRASVLHSVTQAGYVRDASAPVEWHEGRGYVRYLRRTLPPLEFAYSKPIVDLAIHDLSSLGQALDPANDRWVDLDGEGATGVLRQQADALFYQQNLGAGRFGPPHRQPTQPTTAAAANGVPLLMDLAGDGRLRAVSLAGPTPGSYERTEAGSWDTLTPFEHLPRIDWADPDVRLVDLTGDGLADVLVSEDGAFSWYASLGERGFGPSSRTSQAIDEQTGPRALLADRQEAIYLADMSGDGLSDLVRVRNGEVSYWPSLGYGRFGAKVTMDGAPWFDTPSGFDQERVRLADIDGTGTADLVYLGPDGPSLYANRAGNGFGPAVVLRGFPRIDDPATVSLVDVLGNGTACLVWSSALPGDARRGVRFVELLSGGKPYLLVRWLDASGVETRVDYTTSTQFFLADRAADRPWSSRIPFPIHVVDRVQTHDLVSDSVLVNRYAFHDGFYDGIEREFRGFGLIEQWNSESFAALTAEGRLPGRSNVDAATHVPPVLIRTRTHLGRPADGGLLPENLTPAERREAYRALKGSRLRQEVYAHDGDEHEDQPYAITDTTYLVRMLQPRGSNRYGVFFAHDRESTSYHHERSANEPRVRHELNLEVDDFGNVLRYVNVGYGRRYPDPSLEAEEQAIQARDLIVFTENDVTNAIDATGAYRLPQPAASRTYELTGLGRGPGERFSVEQLTFAITTAATRPYQDAPTAGRIERRLIEHLQTLYRRDDLTGPLPSGVLESLALSYEQYRLALTPELVTALYADRVTSEMLAAEGGYVQIDGSWWLASGRLFYSSSRDDPPDAELAEARLHFFAPRRYRTPFGTDTVVTYDHDLLVRETCDPLGNRTTVGERDRDPSKPLVRGGQDYRVLQPRLVMDPNRNRTAVAFDALGLVTGSAMLGPPEADPPRGDTLHAFRADPAPAEVDRFLADPLGPAAAGLLAQATTRIVYDLTARPPVAATISRETHVGDVAPGEEPRLLVSVAYSDGFGQEIQKKAHAEPDASGQPQWATSGWTVFNNKGKPVRKYEPFFSATHRFERDFRAGVSVILCYDPLDRVIAALHPDHTWEKVEVDPWGQVSWDPVDTVLVADPRTDPTVGGHFARLDPAEFLPTWYQRRVTGALGPHEQAAAEKAAAHAATPRRTYGDALARAFLTVEHNRAGDQDEHLRTRITFDVEGNQREIRDPIGRIAMRFDFTIAGNRVHQTSMEGGERRVLPDGMGRPLYTWDDRGHRLRTAYDALRRPLTLHLRDDAHADVLIGRNTYGESLLADEGRREETDARNLRTRIVEAYDQAGLNATEAYDFKGNAIRLRRRFAESYRTMIDWSQDVALEGASFAVSMRFDARNRPVEVIQADGTTIRAAYNEAGLLERVTAVLHHDQEATTFVEGVDYDAKGQRGEIRYGNGTRTTYRRDPDTFRLVELRTTGRTGDIQRVSYVYDPVANVTHIQDDAQQRIFFRGRCVDPSADYTHDAMYRLTEATGREHLGQTSAPYDDADASRRIQLHAEDGQALARYVERYAYDRAGNMLSMGHRSMDPSQGGWTRRFTYAEPSRLEPDRSSNRLTRATVTGITEVFSHDGNGYDAHGSMLRLPHLSQISWDFRDELRMTARQRSASRRECTWYVYDGEGRRVRTVTERADGTIKSERLWFAGFEVFRRHGRRAVTRETVHIMDDNQRVAVVETRTRGEDRGPARLVRYQLADRLDSVRAEVDERGRLISYEEFSPYGSTTLQAVRRRLGTPKRYRFTGKERDEQTGFNYHGARYYAPWLARWTTSDPAGLADGPNLYIYVTDRPTRATDPAGTFMGDSQETMMAMMWDEMGREASAIVESVAGGHAYISPRTNVVEYSGPQGGVGGVWGGAVRAATLRLAPIEDNPTGASLAGMQVGAGLVPVLDPAARLATGTDVIGADTSRRWAAVFLGLDVLPFALELHAGLAPARTMSVEARMVANDARVLAQEGEVLDFAHIGTTGSGTRGPTITNPGASGELCVADVGAHQANLRNPGGPAVTNTEFVEAAGRPVSRLESPIANPGEAANLLNEGFSGLLKQGRIAQPIQAKIAGALQPGQYLAVVDGPMGGHALHATVTDEVIGRQFISGGRFVEEAAAAEIVENGGRVTQRNVYRTEFYDPQAGVCVAVQPGSVRQWVRLE